MFLHSSTGLMRRIGVLSDKLYVLQASSGAYSEESSDDLPTAAALESRLDNTHVLDATESHSIELLHRRLGHADINKIKALIKSNGATGLSIPAGSVRSGFRCEHCAQAKATRTVKSSNSYSRVLNKNSGSELLIDSVTTDLLDAVATDVLGPLLTSITGHKYIITFTELRSKFRWTYLLKSKDEALDKFKLLVTEVSAIGFKIKLLRSDNGGEYTSGEFHHFCVAEKITQRFYSTAHTERQCSS